MEKLLGRTLHFDIAFSKFSRTFTTKVTDQATGEVLFQATDGPLAAFGEFELIFQAEAGAPLDQFTLTAGHVLSFWDNFESTLLTESGYTMLPTCLTFEGQAFCDIPFGGSAGSGSVFISQIGTGEVQGFPVTGGPTPVPADGATDLNAALIEMAGFRITLIGSFTQDEIAALVRQFDPLGGLVRAFVPAILRAPDSCSVIPVETGIQSCGTGVDLSTLQITMDGVDVTPDFPGPLFSEFLLPVPDGGHILSASIRDRAGNSAQPAAVAFFVDATPPTITIEQPADGSVIPDTPVPIRIVYSDGLSGLDMDSIRTMLDGAEIVHRSPTPGITEFSMDMPDGSHQLDVSIRDGMGNIGRASPVSFVADGHPPDAVIDLPVGGSVIPEETTLIRLGYFDGGTGADLSTLQIVLNGEDVTPSSPGDTMAEYALPLPDGSYTLQFSISDHSGLSFPVAFVVAIPKCDFEFETSAVLASRRVESRNDPFACGGGAEENAVNTHVYTVGPSNLPAGEGQFLNLAIYALDSTECLQSHWTDDAGREVPAQLHPLASLRSTLGKPVQHVRAALPPSLSGSLHLHVSCVSGEGSTLFKEEVEAHIIPADQESLAPRREKPRRAPEPPPSPVLLPLEYVGGESHAERWWHFASAPPVCAHNCPCGNGVWAKGAEERWGTMSEHCTYTSVSGTWGGLADVDVWCLETITRTEVCIAEGGCEYRPPPTQDSFVMDLHFDQFLPVIRTERSETSGAETGDWCDMPPLDVAGQYTYYQNETHSFRVPESPDGMRLSRLDIFGRAQVLLGPGAFEIPFLGVAQDELVIAPTQLDAYSSANCEVPGSTSGGWVGNPMMGWHLDVPEKVSVGPRSSLTLALGSDFPPIVGGWRCDDECEWDCSPETKQVLWCEEIALCEKEHQMNSQSTLLLSVVAYPYALYGCDSEVGCLLLEADPAELCPEGACDESLPLPPSAAPSRNLINSGSRAHGSARSQAQEVNRLIRGYLLVADRSMIARRHESSGEVPPESSERKVGCEHLFPRAAWIALPSGIRGKDQGRPSHLQQTRRRGNPESSANEREGKALPSETGSWCNAKT